MFSADLPSIGIPHAAFNVMSYLLERCWRCCSPLSAICKCVASRMSGSDSHQTGSACACPDNAAFGIPFDDERFIIMNPFVFRLFSYCFFTESFYERVVVYPGGKGPFLATINHCDDGQQLIIFESQISVSSVAPVCLLDAESPRCIDMFFAILKS